MGLYSFLDWMLPRSFVAKAVVVAVFLGQGPFIALFAAKNAGVIPQDLANLTVVGTSIGGMLALGIGLSAVMYPVSRLEAAFTQYEAGKGDVVRLPDHHRDTVGRLMAQANRLMHTAETRIDAAQRLADRDPLTGLLNRRGLERSLSGRTMPQARGAVMMMDLDHFKRVNDIHGHDVGDRVLRDLAHLLRRQMRRPDLAARFGGEEFVVYLSGLGQDGALRVAERLRMAVEDNLKVGGKAQTVSIGVAPWPTGDTFATVLKRADMAVYAAKSAGRNRVHLVPVARTAASQETSPRDNHTSPEGLVKSDAAIVDRSGKTSADVPQDVRASGRSRSTSEDKRVELGVEDATQTTSDASGAEPRSIKNRPSRDVA